MCVVFLERRAENVYVCVAFIERRAPNRGSFKLGSKKMSYLILIPERITRAYMQFHNQERQLISLSEIQKCHAARESA